MEVQISSTSELSEKDNKINISKNITDSKLENSLDIDTNSKIENNDNEIIQKRIRIEYKPPEGELKFLYKKIGYTFCFFSDEMGNPAIMIGPHWPIFVCFCGSVTAGYIAFFYYNFKLCSTFYKIYCILSFSLYFISYMATFLLNPGYPERNRNSLIGDPITDYNYCIFCKILIRTDRKILHCFDCGVCIEGYDHHCPWTGKCIGRKTKNYFYAFITGCIIVFFFLATGILHVEAKKVKMKQNKII